MKQLSKKFNFSKPVNIFEEFLSEEQLETTARKIYYDDYELLRKMANFKNKKMLHLLMEIFLEVEPIVLDFEYDKLPEAYRPAYVVNSHKSVRIPVNFVQFLEDHAVAVEQPMKIFLARCIRYYSEQHMPKEFFDMIQYEEKKRMELLRKSIR